MKKWSEIKTEPMTWGSYTRWNLIYAAIVLCVYAAAWIGVLVWYYYDTITEWITNIANKVKSKFKFKK